MKIDFCCEWPNLTRIHSCKEEKEVRLVTKSFAYYTTQSQVSVRISQADTVAERHLTPEMER
jgi:hypothetical protein